MPSSSARLAQISGSLLFFVGIVFGVFGAHLLKAHLAQNNTTETWKTGVQYEFAHALAMLAISTWAVKIRGPVICWLIGTICFSGSLYMLACHPAWWGFGPVTPVGGVFFLVGWVWLLINLLWNRT